MLDFVFQKAINSLSPNVGFTHRGNVIDEWDLGNTGKPKPSQAEIDAEIIRLQAEYDAQEYARNRASAYDSVGNQLDMLMKDMRDGTTTHKDACEAVKAKYPKPS
jgi:hypothetical protein